MLDQKSSRLESSCSQDFPLIPNKLYFSIGEVSKLCNIKSHVLRYWEQEFPQLNPAKRKGNRRYYQRKDVLIVREIIMLLYGQGFTIEGARARLANEVTKDPAPYHHLVQEIIYNLEDIVTELGS